MPNPQILPTPPLTTKSKPYSDIYISFLVKYQDNYKKIMVFTGFPLCSVIANETEESIAIFTGFSHSKGMTNNGLLFVIQLYILYYCFHIIDILVMLPHCCQKLSDSYPPFFSIVISIITKLSFWVNHNLN